MNKHVTANTVIQSFWVDQPPNRACLPVKKIGVCIRLDHRHLWSQLLIYFLFYLSPETPPGQWTSIPVHIHYRPYSGAGISIPVRSLLKLTYEVVSKPANHQTTVRRGYPVSLHWRISQIILIIEPRLGSQIPFCVPSTMHGKHFINQRLLLLKFSDQG